MPMNFRLLQMGYAGGIHDIIMGYVTVLFPVWWF